MHVIMFITVNQPQAHDLIRRKVSSTFKMTRQPTEHTYIEAATPVKQILEEMLTPDSTSVRSWVSPAFRVLCFQYCGSSSVI